MTLPTSGTICMRAVASEYGDSLPRGLISLSSNEASISAPVGIRDFYGCSNIVPSVSVNKDFLSFTQSWGQKPVFLTTNVGWLAEKYNTGDGTNWYFPDPGTGSACTSQIINIGVDDNFGSSREGDIRWDVGPVYDTTTVFQNAYSGGDPCFHPDTPITMADKSIKRLGDIVLGEMVMSYKLPGLKDDESNLDNWSMTDEGFNEAYFVPAIVTNLVHGTYKFYNIINNIMHVTYEHHLFVQRDDVWSFIQVYKIRKGDYFWDGEKRVLVESFEVIHESAPMITLDVEETDVYFAHGVLVHNPIEEPGK